MNNDKATKRLRDDLKSLARDKMHECLCNKFPDWNKVAVDEAEHLTPRAKKLLELVDELCRQQAEMNARIEEANYYELQKIKMELA
jgi:hypothetical protein